MSSMTDARSNARIMFSESLTPKLAKNMEISVFNWAVKHCKAKNIPLEWAVHKGKSLEMITNKKEHLKSMITENVENVKELKSKYAKLTSKAKKIQETKEERKTSFRFIYTTKIRSIFVNLKKEYFKKLFIDGEVHVANAPSMKPDEMDPEIRQAIYDKITAREATTAKWEHQEQQLSGLYTCKACKSDKTTHVSVQTRSADEPMTVYITCKMCGAIRKE